MKTGALVDLAFGPDTAVMALNDAAYACQAYPGAFEVFHAVQALEHAEQLAGVGHVEAHAVVTNADLGFTRVLHGADADARRGAPTCVLDGVGQQVVQGHVDERRVTDHLGQLRDVPDNFAVLVVGRKFAANGLDQGV
ncbi:hypothetical protein D3C76_859370 [compost metagenome]